MNCKALSRFVEATEDSAMTVFILGFSSSRLKTLDFFLLPFLSFFGFLTGFVALGKGAKEVLVARGGEACAFGGVALLDC
jgi:hypothetical protein